MFPPKSTINLSISLSQLSQLQILWYYCGIHFQATIKVRAATTWKTSLAARKVYQGLNKLVKSGPKSAKKELMSFIKKQTRSEVHELCQQNTSSVLKSTGTLESLRNLKFSALERQVSKTCPALWSALIGAATTKKEEGEYRCGRRDVRPHMMTSVAMFCYARKPKTMKVLQESMGLQLWYAGAKRQVELLNSSGFALYLFVCVFFGNEFMYTVLCISVVRLAEPHWTLSKHGRGAQGNRQITQASRC